MCFYSSDLSIDDAYILLQGTWYNGLGVILFLFCIFLFKTSKDTSFRPNQVRRAQYPLQEAVVTLKRARP